MKRTASMFVYIFTFIIMYILISCVGMLFFKSDGTHYTLSECLGSHNWFMFYSLLLGWWMSMITAMETYELLERKGI